ncbi:DNA double-strand break repair nuclease NurA [Halorientalis pallida]|uniref:DNA double-strand break repair nuclease NurA n=1 Tax=Halorientalis pallida TaxID=2479928 RepID=A0A498L5F6_9EURY|nr:DNA double-strand break repair nuclease NurA [Halorientalis pallida]RXK51914.1 DNA double-strand break repair nuclease NurA [Halorientalis pallida]
MTLDPVHFDGIARLAGRIESGVDASDHRDLAGTVWADFLDPLYHEGTPILEPLGDQRCRLVDVEDAALMESPFPTQHGLDSGTINPTTFKNGLVIDVAQAAMAAVPSDLDLHRGRTIVSTVHSNDGTVDVTEDDWSLFDAGYGRGRILQAPRVDRFEQTVVHALALYLAESTHAKLNADVVEDLLILDGPIYPTGLLKWTDQDPTLAELLVEDERPRDVVQHYVDLVERFVQRDVPLVGFVKSTASKAITRTVRRKSAAPWVNDAALFEQILQRTDDDGETDTDVLTFTNWFVSRAGADCPLSVESDLDLDLTKELGPEAYEVTFFVVYDPREELVYRVEAPYAFTRDEALREELTMQIVSDVAARTGPPLAVEKADELARISRQEKAALQRQLEETFSSDRQREYNDVRWEGAEF